MEQLKLSPGKDLPDCVITFREPTVADIRKLGRHKQTVEEENAWGCVLLLEIDGDRQEIEWWDERGVKFYNACVKFVSKNIQRLNDEQAVEGESKSPLE